MALHQAAAALAPAFPPLTLPPPFTIKEREAVSEFLALHPSLTSLLWEVYPAIEHYFGEHVPVTLQLLYDAEEGSVGPLLALVQASGSVKETQDALDRFDNEYWIDHPAQATSPLIIGLG